jgi:NAD(P)-dependent dehydrogenase (short-subunit alcohol dehydrogenase family)
MIFYNPLIERGCRNMSKIQDKVAVITGGVSGIGAATARLFASEGAKLVLVDFNEEKGAAFEAELKSEGYEVVFVKADVTSEEDVKNIYETALKTFGKVDILFNNAGIGAVKPTEQLTYAEWRRTVEVDLDGVFLVAQGAIKEFLKADGGVIVNTASMYGVVGSPGSAAYNAAKAGVINLTRSLGLEYATRNIRVNALCPGFIETPILGDTDREFLTNATPMKRLGKAEEMAKAVLFMASDDSSFMTGNSLVVDGGYTAQ